MNANLKAVCLFATCLFAGNVAAQPADEKIDVHCPRDHAVSRIEVTRVLQHKHASADPATAAAVYARTRALCEQGFAGVRLDAQSQSVAAVVSEHHDVH